MLHVAEPGTGGVPRYVADVSRDQAAAGWHVVVAAPPGSTVAALLRGTSVEVREWPAVAGPSFRMLGEARRIRRIIRDVRPDLVHLHGAKAGMVVRVVVRGRIPTVHQPHSLPWHGRPEPVARLVRTWERWALRWTDRTVFVAGDEARSADLAQVRAPAVVIPNGVDLASFPPRGADDRSAARQQLGLGSGPLAVCIGRLHRQKGQHHLLDVWPEVARRVPGATLVLVGDGPDAAALAARRVPGVQLSGASDEVSRWLAAADVVVLPSRWEGLALTSLEAMACARSVVMTEVDGSSVVRSSGGGATVPLDDPADLAHQLARRLLDPELTEDEGRAGRRWVERHHDQTEQLQALRRLVDTTAGRRDRSRLAVHVVAAHGVLGGSENWLTTLLDERTDLDVRATVLQDGPFVDALRVRGIPTTLRPVGASPVSVLAAIRWLVGQLRRTRPDVLLGNGVKAQLLAGPTGSVARVPTVWVKHDHSYDRLLARALGCISTTVIGTDRAVLEPVHRSDALVVVPPRPPGPPLDRAVARSALRARGLGAPEDQLWLGMATRLVPYKGVEDAVRALAAPGADGWCLVVIGDDDPSSVGETDRLRAVAAACQVEDRFWPLGQVDDAASVMAAFDATAMLTRPAGRGSPRKEGFGGAAMESMLAGTPVVTVAGSPASVRAGDRAGRVVRPGDPADVARALGELADHAVRSDLGAVAQAICADHPDAGTCAGVLARALWAATGTPR